jgi:hypothetical protein
VLECGVEKVSIVLIATFMTIAQIATYFLYFDISYFYSFISRFHLFRCFVFISSFEVSNFSHFIQVSLLTAVPDRTFAGGQTVSA